MRAASRSPRENAGSSSAPSADARVAALDWPQIEAGLDTDGFAVVPSLLDVDECASVAALYDDDSHFRNRVVMERHNYGRGEYRYFSYPLPPLVASLRESLYEPLAGVANRWHEAMRIDSRFPATHREYVARCHAAGQRRPTPLVLRYREGDYNCLHQDLYGDEVFPLQVAGLLSEPGRDFTGGEFVMTEQRPRMQSRPMVIPLHRGDAVVFAVKNRPVRGARGSYRVNLRHGVSRLASGNRFTLGIIFHDAK
jgi:hypothetical protein